MPKPFQPASEGSRHTASSCSIVSSSRSDSSVSSVSAMPASRARRHNSTSRGVSSRCTRWRCARSKRGCIAESFTEMLGPRLEIRVFVDARRKRGDGRAIGVEIAGGIGRGERRLAEHVEGVAIALVGAAQRIVERLLHGAPHHELVAHDAHRLAHGGAHDGLAHAADHAPHHALRAPPRRSGRAARCGPSASGPRSRH